MVHRAIQFRILDRFVFSDLFLGLPDHRRGSFGDWGKRGRGFFYLLRNGLLLRLKEGSAHSRFCGARGEQGPNIPIPLNALGKTNEEDLVIFNLYSNFCTSLVWRGWSGMICIFYMSRIILKKEENREMKPTKFPHLWKNA